MASLAAVARACQRRRQSCRRRLQVPHRAEDGVDSPARRSAPPALRSAGAAAAAAAGRRGRSRCRRRPAAAVVARRIWRCSCATAIRGCAAARRSPSAASSRRLACRCSQPLLADADPDVRAMAAFALGLIGDASAEPALAPLLTDPSPTRARPRRRSARAHRCHRCRRRRSGRWSREYATAPGRRGDAAGR